MNPIYQQLSTNKPTINQAMINKLLQSNPKLRPYMEMIKNGSNPKEMFYQLAKQKGVDPESFLTGLANNMM